MIKYYNLYKVLNEQGEIEYYTFEDRKFGERFGETGKDFSSLEEMARALSPLEVEEVIFTIPGPRAEITKEGFVMEVPLTEQELRNFMEKCKIKE